MLTNCKQISMLQMKNIFNFAYKVYKNLALNSLLVQSYVLRKLVDTISSK